MEMVLCKEDIADPTELRRRLGLDDRAPSTEISRKLLCSIGSRIVGDPTELYVGNRAPADVRSSEEK